MSVPFTYADGTVTVLLLIDGKSIVRSINKTNPSFQNVMRSLKGSAQEVLEALDIKVAVNKKSGGRVTIENDTVMYDGQPLHDNLTNKILEYIGLGLPYDGLMKFLENLMDNDSYKTRQHLYNFLVNKGVPITEDGHFLALKAIQGNWRDKYTGKIDNSIGQVVKMERRLINDDADVACSAGLHAGASEYVNQYGSEQQGDIIVVVKINPRDVVAVPKDHRMQKMRVCQYEVLAKGEFNEQLLDGLYSAEVGAVAPVVSVPGETLDDSDYDDEDSIENFEDDDETSGDDWPEDDEDDDLDEDEDDSWLDSEDDELDDEDEDLDDDIDEDDEDDWLEDEEDDDEDVEEEDEWDADEPERSEAEPEAPAPPPQQAPRRWWGF